MTQARTLFTRPVSRTFAATLGALVAAVVVTTGMAAYLPFGQANSVVLPIILFPVTWLCLFLWALFDGNLWRVWGGFFILAVAHIGVIVRSVGLL